MVDCPTSVGSADVLRRVQAFALAALVAVLTYCFAVGSALAHSDHPTGHDGGGSAVLPGSVLAGSLFVIALGAYLDHTGRVDGRVARLAVVIGIAGVLMGLLVAL